LFIVLDLKFELIRWIAGLADIQKIRYFAQISNIGVAGRCGSCSNFMFASITIAQNENLNPERQ